jgi:tol-pal system protein YbgF
MTKANNSYFFGLFISVLCLLMLSGCATTDDVRNLDMRLRRLNSRLVEVDNNVITTKQESGASVNRVQKQQAGLGANLDRINNDLLQLKGRLDESRNRYRNNQARNKEIIAAIDSRILELNAAISGLNEQLDSLSKQLKGVESSTTRKLQGLETKIVRIQQARAREAAARAEAANRAAKEARRKASQVQETNTIHEIVPTRTKIKAGSTKGSKPAASARTGGSASQKMYDKALRLFKTGKYQKSYDLFNTYAEKYPKSKLAVNSRFWAADCLFKQKEYALAILEYQNVIADHPRHGKAPAALLKQAMAFEALEDKDTARIVYNKIITDFPKSEQAVTARSKLKKLKK